MKYILGTPRHAVVVTDSVSIGELVLDRLKCAVYLTTRSLKHCYDKRTAQEFDLILEHLKVIIETPDRIFRNKRSKRGEICIVKRIQEAECLCSIEIVKEGNEYIAYIVTFFIANADYLASFELLWERKDGAPSS